MIGSFAIFMNCCKYEIKLQQTEQYDYETLERPSDCENFTQKNK